MLGCSSPQWTWHLATAASLRPVGERGWVHSTGHRLRARRVASGAWGAWRLGCGGSQRAALSPQALRLRVAP